MRRTPKWKWTRRKVVCFRVFLCTTVGVGILGILLATLFWGTVAAHVINFLRYFKPFATIITASSIIIAAFTTFATIWSLFFGTPKSVPENVRKLIQRVLIAVLVICIGYVPFYALDQLGFAQWLISCEQDNLTAVESFLDDTTLESADTGIPAGESAPIGPSLSQIDLSADAYSKLNAEQYRQMFYLPTVNWYGIDDALKRHSFYMIETQLLHGDFPDLVSAVRDAVHTRLAQRAMLYQPALTVRVQMFGGKGECSLLEAMDACDAWDTECGDSADLEECLAQHQYLQQLYRDHPCERLARLYADACYRVQDRLSVLTNQAIEAEVLLYYIAEEIAAYEALYRQTRSWKIFEELTGAYARIAASGLVTYGDRLRALMLANTDLPPDCI